MDEKKTIDNATLETHETRSAEKQRAEKVLQLAKQKDKGKKPVRVDARTVIFVKNGKSDKQAIDDFIRRQNHD